MVKASKANGDYDELYRMMKKASAKRKMNLNPKDARKLLTISRLEMVKSRLRQMRQEYIAYTEFIKICHEACPGDQGWKFAKILDDSGTVIVLGDIVFLRPHQLASAIQGVIPWPLANHTDDARVMELGKMENQKADIDRKAEQLVRRELWCWLVYLIVQTTVIVILAFKKLSWNVMEPICYCIGYVYLIARMIFFLWTSTEPSLKSFYESRLAAKQKRLMKFQNFQVERYNELQRFCTSPSSEPLRETVITIPDSSFSDDNQNNELKRGYTTTSSSAPSWETVITIPDFSLSDDNQSQHKKKE